MTLNWYDKFFEWHIDKLQVAVTVDLHTHTKTFRGKVNNLTTDFVEIATNG